MKNCNAVSALIALATMTQESDEIQIENRAVLSFDICSSTQIVDGLHTREKVEKWRSLLIHIKEFLVGKSEDQDCPFELYNFTGDGWIVLFEPKPDGKALMRLLKSLCEEYQRAYESRVKPNLDVSTHYSWNQDGHGRRSGREDSQNERTEGIHW